MVTTTGFELRYTEPPDGKSALFQDESRTQTPADVAVPAVVLVMDVLAVTLVPFTTTEATALITGADADADEAVMPDPTRHATAAIAAKAIVRPRAVRAGAALESADLLATFADPNVLILFFDTLKDTVGPSLYRRRLCSRQKGCTHTLIDEVLSRSPADNRKSNLTTSSQPVAPQRAPKP